MIKHYYFSILRSAWVLANKNREISETDRSISDIANVFCFAPLALNIVSLIVLVMAFFPSLGRILDSWMLVPLLITVYYLNKKMIIRVSENSFLPISTTARPFFVYVLMTTISLFCSVIFMSWTAS